MKIATIVFLLCLLGFQNSLFAQDGAMLNSDGKDFFIGYMPSSNKCSRYNQYNSAWALVTTQFEATVNINYFDASGKEINGANYKLTRNSSKRIKLTTSYMDLDNNDGEHAEFKACHIKSTAPISVQYYSTGPNSCGLYLALPNTVLGRKYVVMTLPSNPGVGRGSNVYCSSPDSSSSEFMVVAPYDSTHVTIIPTGYTIGGRAGVCHGANSTNDSSRSSFTVTLQRGQVYMVKATKDDYGNSEEGSIVNSDKPVAVIAAEENALNGTPLNNAEGEDLRDLMVEEMMPVEYWGTKDFFSMPFRDVSVITDTDPNRGDQYRVYGASFTGVNYRTPTTGSQIDSAGRFCRVLKLDNVEKEIAIASTSSVPIGVEMFDYRQHATNGASPAPSQMNIVPASSWRKNYCWMVPDNQIIANRVFLANIIAPKDSMLKIKISTNGGAGVPVTSFPVAGEIVSIPGRQDLQGRRILLNSGSYALSGNTPCAVYLYGMEEFNADSYAHDFSYAAPAGQSFNHEGGKPQIKIDTNCADWHVTIADTLAADDGIAIIELLNDPDGIFYGKPIISTNVRFRPLDYELLPGTTRESISIEITNPLNDAFAALLIVNRAGKDTLIQLQYRAPRLALTKGFPGTQRDQDSIGFPVALIHDQACSYFTLKNTSAVGGRAMNISSVVQTRHDPDIKISGTIPAIPKGGLNLNPGDTLQIDVCYTASDTGITHYDTVVINTDCFRARAIVTGSGNTPLIQATDWNYGEVLVGDTTCHTVKVTNKGTAPLTLEPNYLLTDKINFSLGDTSVLPKTLKPGESINVSICFHPVSTVDDTATIFWANDLRDPFKHQIKDYSGLFGRGIQKGLQWDRIIQIDTLYQNTSKVIRVWLKNTASSITNVDSVVFNGPNSPEYEIIGNEIDYDPLERFPIGTADSIWVDVQFTPDNSRHLTHPFEDRHASLVAYGENGTIVKAIDFASSVIPPLSVRSVTSEAVMSIYPNPAKNSPVVVRINSEVTQKGVLQLFDVLGSEMYSKRIELVKGPTVVSLPFSTLKQGSYYLRLDTGDRVESQKLIVQ